tara:strand:+ start:796 stop:1023 length:228 start_codon:yes stop_codon:yes gene_type:complete
MLLDLVVTRPDLQQELRRWRFSSPEFVYRSIPMPSVAHRKSPVGMVPVQPPLELLRLASGQGHLALARGVRFVEA